MRERRLLPTRFLLAPVVVAVLTGCAIQIQPLTEQERQASISADLGAMYAQQEPVQGPVTLEQAMARAIKYNLDHRVKLMEEAIARQQFDLSRIDLLPKLVASAGYTSRSNDLASSSSDVVNHTQSLVPSTSSDRTLRNADLSLSWNVLDFGVSYYTARQQADRLLIAQEHRRKVLHLLMQQTRQAYWQAAGAQKLQDQIGPVLTLAKQALDDSRKVELEKLRSPLEALTYQRQLLDIVRQLEGIRDELAQAKPKLASIMNMQPGQVFDVVLPTTFDIPRVALPTGKMEEQALLHRPELVEAQYNERMSVLETRKALAKLFPGIEISLGDHYDSNSFLVNRQWSDVGLRVSWNLLNVFNAGAIRGYAQAQVDVAREQRLALNMAVLTQVHVAQLEYLGRVRQYELTEQLNTVEQRILKYTRSAATASTQGKLDEIRASTSAMMSELRLYQAYGALQGAYGQVAATLGLDPLPESVAAHDLNTLGDAVHTAEHAWGKIVDPKKGS